MDLLVLVEGTLDAGAGKHRSVFLALLGLVVGTLRV